VTAPATDAPTTAPDPGGDGEGTVEGQAPDTAQTGSTAPAPGKRPGQEHVRSASRDDDAARDDTPTGDVDDDPVGDKAAKAGKDWKVDDLPPGAQKYIADLRKEAGTRRSEAAEAKKAADAAGKKATATDEKFASAVEAFTKALGLTPDADEPERSPEELLGEVTSKYQQSRIELAVYRAASAAGADPDALLDSRGFLTKAFALDPAADEFDTSIADAIAEAVESNPKLRAAEPYTPPAVPSGGDFGGGPAERNEPDNWSVDDFRRQRRNASGI
jgi:hypothetical protein